MANRFKSKQIKWYRLNRILSRNAVINIVLGPRGDGKTYAAKEKAIKDAINKGDQFIYLRRYKTELQGRFSFFDDIRQAFPDYGLRVHGWEAQLQRPGEKKWETIGFFAALSNSQQRKSVPYPRVTLIIFDEFIIDSGAIHYLPGEVKALLDFLSTVDRYQDKTRLLMISNTVSIANQYFVAWNIRPKPDQEFYVDPSGFLAVQFIKDNEFAREVRQTRMGKFIDGTAYGDYAIDGVFLDNHEGLVKPKPAHAVYRLTLETPTGMFSWWEDSWENTSYITVKRPRGDEAIFTLMPDQMDEGKIYLPPNAKLLQGLRSNFAHGRLYFDGPQARNAFIGMVVK